MPHTTLRLIPTVNTVETQALNENSGISSTNLVRFQPDPGAGSALVQKLGGWTKFYPQVMAAVVRAIWAWEDLDAQSWLAIGTQPIVGPGHSQLAVISNGSLEDITPTQVVSQLFMTNSSAVATIGSPSILINDTNSSGQTNVVSVYIATQIAVGGVVLFGEYPCDPDGFTGPSGYTVYALDQLGNLLPATTTDAPVLPLFSTISRSNVVTVALPVHGYSVGLTFPILLPSAVGGLTLFGNYVIQSVIDRNTFTILASAPATIDDTQQLNGGTGVFIYNGLNGIPNATTPIAANDWTMDNFGEDLVACSTSSTSGLINVPYQPIYLWSPNAQQPTAVVISQAPPVNDGIFVAMPQRQIVAWGSTQTGVQDPLLVRWCDVNNPYQWTPLVINQAGSFRIPKGSHIVAGVQGPQQGLLWTDIDLWSMQYIGPPFVYSFNEIGTGCGLIARKAAASFNGIFYWMGPSQFFTLGGAGVQPLPCSAWDAVYQNLDQSPAALSKIRVAVNSRFGEIQWFYPSANGGGEVDSYVKYNVYAGLWDYGSLARTAWVDQSVLGPPIGADPGSLYLYQHETSNDADGQAMLPFFRSGYFALQDGDFKTFVDLVWPDMKWGMFDAASNASVQITFYCVDYPGDTPEVFGPYTVSKATQFFNTRLRARLVSVQISSNDLGTWWRIGALRYRYAPDGKF